MLMFDSDNPGAIPETAEAVCLYGDGLPGSAAPTDWARFPDARLVVACRDPSVVVAPQYTGGAVVADCAAGDTALTAATFPAWAQAEHASFPTADVCCYVNQATWAALAAVAPLFVVHFWIADYSITELPAGASALQYASTSTSGGDYDLSITTPTWPPERPDPTPTPTEVLDMRWGIQTYTPPGGAAGLWAIIPGPTGLRKAHVATPADVTALEAMGAVAVAFTDTVVAAMPTVTLEAAV